MWNTNCIICVYADILFLRIFSQVASAKGGIEKKKGGVIRIER